MCYPEIQKVLVRCPGNVAVTCPAGPDASVNDGFPVDLNAPWRTFPQTCHIWESHPRWYELLEYRLLAVCVLVSQH